MITTSTGYTTNGDYVKFKSPFTSFWKVDTKEAMFIFKDEPAANRFIAEYKQCEILKEVFWEFIPGIIYKECK